MKIGGDMKEARRAQVALRAVCCISCCVLLVFIAACGGKKEVKEVSRESTMAQEAFAIAEAVRDAYVRKEFAAVTDRCTKEGYRDIIDSIRYFDSVDLTFAPRWVEIDKSKVYVNIAWKGTWVVGKNTIRERGMTVFQMEGTPLQLSKIVRGNPFKYPEQ
jgi:hypothetical protein